MFIWKMGSDGVHVGFSECIDIILNWTSLEYVYINNWVVYLTIYNINQFTDACLKLYTWWQLLCTFWAQETVI